MDFNPIVIEINQQAEEIENLKYSIHKRGPSPYFTGESSPRLFAFDRRKEVKVGGSFVGRNGLLKVGEPFKLAAKDELKDFVVEFKELIVTEIERTNKGCLYLFITHDDYKEAPQTNQDALNYLKKGDW